MTTEEGPVGPNEEGAEGQSVGETGTPERGFKPRGARRRVARTSKPGLKGPGDYTGEERLLLLDTWQRSELPATEFSHLVGVSTHTLYNWRKRFEAEGPAALLGYRSRKKGSRLPEHVKRAILMMKESHPDWGQDRIHDMLVRTQGISASGGAVQRVLIEAGYQVESTATKPHPPKAKRFERSRPNELWQTDLFTFLLKRQRRRVHLVCYMDDFSRFIVGFGLHASASGAMVRETFEASIANYGAPAEILTDNGSQYVTWRGKSAFKKLCERRGIEQVVATPRRPQTLGKIERFWGSLWRELIEGAIFRDMEDARTRIGHFIGFYNFQRTHQGIEGLVPADRFFEASKNVRAALEERVAQNAKDLALHGEPRKPLYLTGRIGDENVSLHSEGDRVLLTDEQGVREEVDLKAAGRRREVREAKEEEAPGSSVLDDVLEDLKVLEESEPGAPGDEPAAGSESGDAAKGGA